MDEILDNTDDVVTMGEIVSNMDQIVENEQSVINSVVDDVDSMSYGTLLRDILSTTVRLRQLLVRDLRERLDNLRNLRAMSFGSARRNDSFSFRRRKCMYGTRRNYGYRRFLRCYKCHEQGHVLRDCPDFPGCENCCFTCGQHGHFRRNCPANMDSMLPYHRSQNLDDYTIIVNLEIVGVVKAVLDTGSPISFLNEDILPDSALMGPLQKRNDFYCLHNSRLNIVGRVELNVQVNEEDIFPILFYIVPSETIPFECVLGRDFMRKAGIVLSFRDGFAGNNNQRDEFEKVFDPTLDINIQQCSRTWDEIKREIDTAINNSMVKFYGRPPPKVYFGIIPTDGEEDAPDSFYAGEQDGNVNSRPPTGNDDAIETAGNDRDDSERGPSKQFEVGQYVLIRNTFLTGGIRRKFVSGFRGPYVVRKILDENRYIVSEPNTFPQCRIPYMGIATAENMRSWFVR